MYFEHFGLKEPPFKITPNTNYFFPGGNRGAILDALVYAVKNGEGIVKVVGEVGTGKTMLCRMLQKVLPDNIESIYLANPSVAPEDVLHAIAFELQLKLPKNVDRLKVLQILQSHLLNRHAEGKQVVIFVEEAQGMPIATLEEIRLLSNLETKQDKLLQIVLFGQPELDENLNKTHIRQLRERITHSFALTPLSEQDVNDYIDFRLRAAGYKGPPLLTKKAIKTLSDSAQGLARRINILADKALLAAFAANDHQITPRHVKAAIYDSEFGRKPALNKHFYWAVGGAVLALVALFFYFWYQADSLSKETALKEMPGALKSPGVNASITEASAVITPAHPTPAHSDSAPLASAAETTQSIAVKLDEIESAKQSKAQTASAKAMELNPPTDSPTSTPAKPVSNAKPQATQNALPAQSTNVSTSSPTPPAASPKPLSDNKVASSVQQMPSPKKPVEQKPVAAPLANTKSAGTKPTELKTSVQSDLDKRKEITKSWLFSESSQTYTLQIAAAKQGSEEAMFDQMRATLGEQNLHAYQKQKSDAQYTVITYGTYGTLEEAQKALQNLPPELKPNAPLIKTIGRINKEVE